VRAYTSTVLSRLIVLLIPRRAIVRCHVKTRCGARWGAAIIGVAGLGLALALAPARAALIPASPSPAKCGSPISSWSGAIANDVSVDLIEVERVEMPASGTPSASPVPVPLTFFAELRVENLGDSPASIAVGDITLVLCDGGTIAPMPDTTHTPLAEGALPAGATRTGWIAFAAGVTDVPVRLVVPVLRPGLVGGKVEFPLADVDGDLVATGTPDSVGVVGADAVGGDAVGGDGAEGAEATGATDDSGSD
jgi:hypothetical protein